MRSGTTRLAVVAVIFCILFSYVLPTLVERSLAQRIGPVWAYIVLGGLVGCVATGALTRWGIGLGLYVLVSSFETVLFRLNLVSPGGLSWFSSILPTAFLCLVVGLTRMRFKT